MPVVAKTFRLITRVSLPTFLEDADSQSLRSKTLKGKTLKDSEIYIIS